MEAPEPGGGFSLGMARAWQRMERQKEQEKAERKGKGE